ncbi:MAG: TatD family hydrolase [Anaerolineae bacterium]|nr:TatD family hydrolase [Anaerolineae bacterium]
MELTDTHCHLYFEHFDQDREAVITRAIEVGLTRILVPGIDLASSTAAVELAEKYEQVYAAVGIHPNSANTWQDSTLKELRSLANRVKVVAIGEIGLDYYRDQSPRYVQEQVFRHQLALAADLNLPVIIHNRQATRDVVNTLSNWQIELKNSGSDLQNRPGVLHSYSGNIMQAKQMIAQNFYFGISGPVTFKNAVDLRETVNELNIRTILIETDAPFLSPHPHRGKRNEPGQVRLVAEKIAELHALPVSEVAKITADNASRLFDW